MTYSHYEQLAYLFDFPTSELVYQVQRNIDYFKKDYPEAAAYFTHFLEGLPQNLLDLQELHTRTFDVQSITTLDIGYVLFGDDYKRGELLSNLNREHVNAGIDCRGELADHLSNVLRLIPRLQSEELRNELVREILVPSLMLMIREFDPNRIEKKNENYERHFKTLIEKAASGTAESTIYLQPLEGLLKVLVKDFPVQDTIEKLSEWQKNQSADFLGLVQKEMEIETNANPVNSGCDY